MNRRKSRQTGIWWRKRHKTLRSISASVGDWLGRRFRRTAVLACRARKGFTRVFTQFFYLSKCLNSKKIGKNANTVIPFIQLTGFQS